MINPQFKIDDSATTFGKYRAADIDLFENWRRGFRQESGSVQPQRNVGETVMSEDSSPEVVVEMARPTVAAVAIEGTIAAEEI